MFWPKQLIGIRITDVLIMLTFEEAANWRKKKRTNRVT